MLEGFLLSIPGITTIILVWCGFLLWNKRRRIRLAEEYGSCKFCGIPFSEAQIEYQGAVTKTERAELDRFQSRFAAFKVLCRECGAVNICTTDGRAYTAKPQE